MVSCEGRGSDSVDDAIIFCSTAAGIVRNVSLFLSIELNGKNEQDEETTKYNDR